MNLMVDTNIFIDVLTEREPFFQSSKEFLKLCEENIIHGFVSASSVTDIYYLVRRQLHSTELAYKSLGYVLDIVKILPVTNENVLDAYTKKASDFEDCLLATCAKSNKCNGIVTRNSKDFENFNIKLYAPENILASYCKQ